MKKPHARIDNWRRRGPYLQGRISGHPRQSNFLDENEQMTSALVSFNEAEGKAETQNTVYTLGTKASE